MDKTKLTKAEIVENIKRKNVFEIYVDNLSRLYNWLCSLTEKELESTHMTFSEYASSETLGLLKNSSNKKDIDDGFISSGWDDTEVFKFLTDINTILNRIEYYSEKFGIPLNDFYRELGIDRTRKSKWKKDPSMEAISLSRLLVSQCPSVEEYDDIVRNWVNYMFPEILIGRNLILERSDQNVWDEDLLGWFNIVLFDYRIYNQKTGPIGSTFSAKIYQMMAEGISKEELRQSLNCDMEELTKLMRCEEFEDKRRYCELYRAFVTKYGIDRESEWCGRRNRFIQQEYDDDE